MFEERKKKGTQSRTTVTTPKLPALQPAPPVLQRQPSRAEQAIHAINAHTWRPVQGQQRVLQPLQRALSLHAEEVSRVDGERASLQRQIAEHSPISHSDIQQALQRLASGIKPVPIVRQPKTVSDWVTVMRQQAEQAEGRRMSSRESMQFSALQRQISQTLTQSYLRDRQPPLQRQQEYGQHIVALQRHPLSGLVGQVFLRSVPAGERPALQRAVDDLTQQETLQREQDEQALQLHSLQRQLADLEQQATLSVTERIQQRRGAGNPLPEAIQRHLEQGLNYDLSAVRIHDDAEADKLASKVNAVAFTTGQDIYFRSGKFNPNSQSGLELLAHEVTHTVQQARGEVGPGLDPSPAKETEARETGKRLSLQPLKPQAKGGGRLPLSGKATRSVSNALQRKAKEPENQLLQAVNSTKTLVQTGKIDAAVQSVKKLPADQRDIVVGLLSTMKLPAWDRFRNGLITAQVRSPSIDLCLAGPAIYDPLKGQTLVEVSLANARQYTSMPLGTKLEKAIGYAPVGEAFRKQLLSMVSISALAGAAAIFVALQLTPEGWALDAAVVVIALATYGPAAFTIGEHLGAFFRTADHATSEQDLKIAGNHFAQAVAILGTAGLAGLIGRAVGKATGKGVVKQQDKGLGVPTTAQQALPLWKTQYDAAIKQGLTPKQASLSATMKVQAPTTKPIQPASSMNAVYEGSRVANQELIPLTKTLARRYDVKFQTRDGLKEAGRSTEKVNSDYGGNAGQLLDVSGSRLLFNKLDDVYGALAYIRSKYNVVQIKDRFVEPQGSGYRDIVLNIRASNGYVVELRLEITKMSNYAALEHQWYKERRSIEALLKQENRPATPQEKARLAELKKLAEGGYAAIWEEIKKANK